MSRRASSNASPPQANKSRKLSHGKSDSIKQASSSTSAARIFTEAGVTAPDISSADPAASLSSKPDIVTEALDPSAPGFEAQPQHNPRDASGYLPTPEPESQIADSLASAAGNITIMSDAPVPDIMSPPATSPVAPAIANTSASVSSSTNGIAQASSLGSNAAATAAPRASQTQAAPREQVHASGYRWTHEHEAPGYMWQNKKAQDDADRAWEQITDKDRLIGKMYGDVLMRG